jgi:hypothetical protein
MCLKKDELDHFKEKSATILQIFCQKGHVRIRYNYSGYGLAKKIRIQERLQNIFRI